MRRLLLVVPLWALACAPALAQYPSPQSLAPRGRYVRVPRAAPQAAVREVAPQTVRERLVIPRAAPQTVQWPWYSRLGYRIGRHIADKHRPRMVVELEPQPDAEAFRVVYVPAEEVVAETPAPEEDVVYVADEEPVFAPRALEPVAKPTPRALEPVLKPTPRALQPVSPREAPGMVRKATPRAVPSPQTRHAAPPPPVAGPIGEPTETEPADEMEPAPGDDG